MSQAATLNKRKSLTRKVATSPVKLVTKPVKMAIGLIKKIMKHWLLLLVALFVDATLGIIPFVGIIINPLFTLFVFLYWSGKPKKKNLAISMLISTGIGMIIEMIPSIHIAPTNLANAVISIISK